MTDREKLIEIVRGARKATKNANCDLEREMIFADRLLANGVIVLPCKVGDTIYRIKTVSTFNYVCVVTTKEIFEEPFTFDHIKWWGKSCFATREEAEAALKEEQG